MYVLRPATDADRAFLYQLHRATMQAYVAQTWGWDEAVFDGLFQEGFNPASQQIIVVDGQDVGVVWIERRPDCLFLARIEILPACQRRGLGAAVVRDLLARARDEGRPVALRVLKVNHLARRLYERLGFIVTGETPTHYLMQAGSSEPAG